MAYFDILHDVYYSILIMIHHMDLLYFITDIFVDHIIVEGIHADNYCNLAVDNYCNCYNYYRVIDTVDIADLVE